MVDTQTKSNTTSNEGKVLISPEEATSSSNPIIETNERGDVERERIISRRQKNFNFSISGSGRIELNTDTDSFMELIDKYTSLFFGCHYCRHHHDHEKEEIKDKKDKGLADKAEHIPAEETTTENQGKGQANSICQNIIEEGRKIMKEFVEYSEKASNEDERQRETNLFFEKMLSLFENQKEKASTSFKEVVQVSPKREL